jgi:putative inorganic carbon (hco3(-)) transporter
VGEAAALAGALGAALLVLASSRWLLLAGLLVILAAAGGLAVEGDQADSVGTLLGSAAGLAALVGGVIALLAAAAVLARWPVAIVPALVAVAPIRLPIASDPDSPVLLGLAGTGGLGRLYLLYGVLAAAVLALGWRAARGAPLHPVPRALGVPASAFLVFVMVSYLWSSDPRAATQDLLFFWLPFTVLFVAVAQAPFLARSPRLVGTTLVAVAAVFAAIGIWQAATEELFFFNVSLERANELGSIFRVTSAFQDPNLLGRHLVIAVAVVLVAAWLARVAVPATLALLALLVGGLWFTYSQSSLVALAAVALAVGIAAARGRARLALVATTAVLAVGGVLSLGVVLTGNSSVDLTSGRSALVTDTAAVAANHPIVGVGVSAQPRATRREEAPETSKLQSVSHTTALTVAAELGVLGVIALLALLVGAARTLMDVARRDRATALGAAAVLLVLLVHSFFYPGLFENPLTWVTLGVIAAAASQLPGQSPAVPERAPHAALRS